VERNRDKGLIQTISKAACLTSQGLNQLLWPAVCDNCGGGISETDKSLCQQCWDDLLFCAGADYCPNCGRDVSRYALLDGKCQNCLGEQIHFDGIARGGVYLDALRDMILKFKLSDRTELDRHLSFIANSALQGSSFYDQIDFFVPVPLHWRRRAVRGYNQSLIIAKNLSHPSAWLNTDLVRIRYTKEQPSMTSPRQRALNVAGAFAVRYGHKLAQKNVCLVDDVKTTGATLNECARVLKQAGASKVFALVLAVAGRNTPLP
jgi:ComF family protein